MTEAFAYNDDGNLLSDGRFNYTWDCEGHLIGASTLTNLPASVPLINASYSYDYMSRRSRKIVGSTTNTFIYDGWNLIREIEVTSTNSVTNSYVWGLDLSQSLQGAGGVGGLLCVIRNGTPYYPYYDGNGNITDYVDTNGVVVAHREYDAFGNTVVATGSMVNDFHFWFSTKYLDQETGLYYYGYRYYSPSMGRWLSRDPIGEIYSLNLFQFIYNDPLNDVDVNGFMGNRPRPPNRTPQPPDAGNRGKDKGLTEEQQEMIAEAAKLIAEAVGSDATAIAITIAQESKPCTVIGGYVIAARVKFDNCKNNNPCDFDDKCSKEKTYLDALANLHLKYCP